MYLPRPYPDELLGSMLSRAMWQLGLSQKYMMPRLTGKNTFTISTTITSHEGVARAFGMDMEEFIRNHTLLPYAIAFMSSPEKYRILNSILSGNPDLCIAAVAQNAMKSTSTLRFCVACVAQDILQYGETYWRRSHQLPGVLLCAVHERPLRLSNVNIRSKRYIAPPNKVQSSPASTYGVSQAVLLCISRFSNRTLRHGLSDVDWTKRYCDLATINGYALTGGHIFGEVLSTDLHSFFGDSYLNSLGANINFTHNITWPALLVRSSSINSTALKHVLLNIFLLSSPTPSRSPTDFERRKKAKPVDWELVQRKAITRLDQEVALCKLENRRITVKELAQKAGIELLLHHHRHQTPMLTLWLDQFKCTAQSSRQTGKRPRIYKKNI